jgi:hypothetical protein
LWFPWWIDTVSMARVDTRYQHSTLPLGFVLIAVAACALNGCWEEIHYTPPPPEATPTANATPATADQPTDFGDNVAKSLSEESSQAAPPGETASAVGDSEPARTPSSLPTPTEPASEAASPPATVSEPAAVPTPPVADPAHSPRRIAWLLGSNLSLAALANDRAASAEKVAEWFDKAHRLAALLNTTVSALPPRPTAAAADPAAGRALDYLFNEGQSLGRHLAREYGDDHAALFELALKSNILLVRYQPGAPVVKALSAAISQAGERAKLPPELYQPLLKLLDENAPAKDVRDAVFEMHANVDRYLSTPHP